MFDHPWEGTQIPKGRLSPSESTRDAAIRELVEESGLELEPSRFVGHMRRQFTHPADASVMVEEDWHVWQFDAPPDCPDSWIHFAEEEDMEFAYRWIPLDSDAPDLVHDYFRAVVELITPPSA